MTEELKVYRIPVLLGGPAHGQPLLDTTIHTYRIAATTYVWREMLGGSDPHRVVRFMVPADYPLGEYVSLGWDWMCDHVFAEAA